MIIPCKILQCPAVLKKHQEANPEVGNPDIDQLQKKTLGELCLSPHSVYSASSLFSVVASCSELSNKSETPLKYLCWKCEIQKTDKSEIPLLAKVKYLWNTFDKSKIPLKQYICGKYKTYIFVLIANATLKQTMHDLIELWNWLSCQMLWILLR